MQFLSLSEQLTRISQCLLSINTFSISTHLKTTHKEACPWLSLQPSVKPTPAIFVLMEPGNSRFTCSTRAWNSPQTFGQSVSVPGGRDLDNQI